MTGDLILNTPTSVHLHKKHGRHTCLVIVPMAWVDHITYDNEGERQ